MIVSLYLPYISPEELNQSYVLDTGVLLNLIRGKQLGSRIDREFGLSRAMRLHTISIVTHGELKVLAERHERGAEKRSVLAVALDNLVTVNIESKALVEAYGAYSSKTTSLRSHGKSLSKVN